MVKKRHHKKTVPLEAQVNRIVDFFATHEWAGPIAMPLNLHKDLDTIAELYLFDCYINLRHAKEKLSAGNIEQAKKDLAFSNMFKGEAYEAAFYSGMLNKFTIALFNKTDDLLDDAVEEIFADECPTRKNDWSGFCDFKMKLEERY